MRSTLLLDNKEYEDFVDITAEEFYDVVVNNLILIYQHHKCGW